jgi:hypothetical protein
MEEKQAHSSEEHKCTFSPSGKQLPEQYPAAKMKIRLVREKDWLKFDKKKEKYYNILKYEMAANDLLKQEEVKME